MSPVVLLILGAVAIAAALAAWLARVWAEDSRWPAALRGSQVLLSEQSIQSGGLRPLSAVVDQVLEHADGLVVVESKTRDRARVYPSDQIQLSVQATILRRSQRRPVQSTGYVRAVTPNGTRFLRVALLSDCQVDALHDLRRELDAGRRAPRPPRHSGPCNGCGHSSTCPARRRAGI